MSAEKIKQRVKASLKIQELYLPLIAFLILVVFPIIITAYYMPKNFQGDIMTLQLIQLILPLLSPLWIIKVLQCWLIGVSSEILYFVEPHPLRYACAFAILFDVLVAAFYGIIRLIGMKFGKEWIKIVLLCLIIQGVTMFLLLIFKSVTLAYGGAVFALYALCFLNKSPFLWNIEETPLTDRHMIRFALFAIAALTVINLFSFSLWKRLDKR